MKMLDKANNNMEEWQQKGCLHVGRNISAHVDHTVAGKFKSKQGRTKE